MKVKILLLLILLFVQLRTQVNAQILSNSTKITITKTWSQEPNGWTYPIFINVPGGAAPDGGFPVCILLHGNGGNGENILQAWKNTLNTHVCVAVSGYLKSWNIDEEKSDAPDVEMMNDLIDSIQTYSNINPNKIRILGQSNGSALVNRVFIENKDTGIDIFCAIGSQLNENQYHDDNFYYPGGETVGSDIYGGYDIISTPIKGRKYLSVCNTNDPIIPYNGGPSVGVMFLPAETAIFIIAKSQGYTGSQLTGTLLEDNVHIFSYLSDQVVLLNGDAKHGINAIQKEYIKNYFNNSHPIVGLNNFMPAFLELYPNPCNSTMKVLGSDSELGYKIFNLNGQEIINGITANNTVNTLELLTAGVYVISFFSNDKMILIKKIIKTGL